MGRVLGSDSGLVTGRANLGAPTAVESSSALERAQASKPLIAGLVVAIPTLVLYWRTLMPDVGFWDTAEFQAIGPVLGIAHPTGYPLYTMLAWVASVVLQPFGNEALRANLMSAICVAIAVGVVAALVTRLTGRLVVGAATGVALAVSGETWAIGLRADPHALHLMLAAVLLLLLVVWQDKVTAGERADRWLFAAAVVFGASLANHALTYLLAPGIAIFVLLVQPRILLNWRLILACLAGLVVTTAVLYAYLPIRSLMNPPLDYANPETWDNFRYLVFAEQFRGTFKALPSFLDALRTVATETLDQLGLFAILAVVGVFVTAWRRPALMLLLTIWFAVNWFFALGYLNADIGRYYLVPILAAAVLGGLGAGAILDWISDLVAGRRPGQPDQANSPASSRGTGWQGTAIAVVAAIVLIVPSLWPVPTRFRQTDASGDHIARAWLASVTEQLPRDAVVVSWWSYSTTLWYGQYVEHRRPDITVIDDSTIVQQDLGSVSQVIDSYLGERPVFLIRLASDLPQYQDQYVLTPLPGVVGGTVYEVEGMRADSGPSAYL